MLQLLLVDDEMSVVDTLAATIPWESIGIGAVHKAYSGSEAINMLNMHEIDIVITDVQMPGMDGLELARHIYTYWKHVKCLLLTAHADFEYAQQAIKHNIQGYMVKPVEDHSLIEQVASVVEIVQEERKNQYSIDRAMQAIRHHLPRLQADLLNDLLSGKRMESGRLEEQLRLLEIPLSLGRNIVMMLVRYKEQLSDYNSFEISLMEYAIGNLATETFSERFYTWYCRDVHEYLVFVLIPKDRDGAEFDKGNAHGVGEEAQAEGVADETITHELKRLASQFQMNVQRYLNKPVSVLSGPIGSFPQDVLQMYNNLLLLFGKRFGSDKELPVYIAGQNELAGISILASLYEPPQLVHLMEAGHWEAVADKLEAIIHELETEWSESSEQLTEAFFSIFSAFSYIAHKSGVSLANVIGSEYGRGKELQPTRTVRHLKDWTSSVLDTFRQNAMKENRSARTSAVKEAQKYVMMNLSSDPSVQMISDMLGMHPAYLSRLYKLETGENISEFIVRKKMDRAAQLLKGSTMKIYEIAIEVGYQNPNYFIKVFKKHYGATPQEYRNQNR